MSKSMYVNCMAKETKGYVVCVCSRGSLSYLCAMESGVNISSSPNIYRIALVLAHAHICLYKERISFSSSLRFFKAHQNAEAMPEAPDIRDKSLEELEEEITCAVCHGHYQEAKLLPCMHYYCRACIEKLAERSRGRPSPARSAARTRLFPQAAPSSCRARSSWRE